MYASSGEMLLVGLCALMDLFALGADGSPAWDYLHHYDREGRTGHDWSQTTWKGSRREQHRAHLAQPFRRKIEFTEEMCDRSCDHRSPPAEGAFLYRPPEQSCSELKSGDREQSGHPLRVLLLGLGQLDDYQPSPLRSSQVWVSATPFVAQRHLKKRGTKRDLRELWHCPQNFLATVLREELARLIGRRLDLADLSLEAIEIEPVVDEHGVFRIGTLRPIQFKRVRQKRSDDGGSRPAGSFRLDFGREASGPIALGHSCHFGLGVFVPGDSG
jgi:hypothetical protein